MGRNGVAELHNPIAAADPGAAGTAANQDG
jgi:hypothetical protein